MQTHPTPLNASSSSLLSQAQREPLANGAETKANEKALSFSTSKALGKANAGDKKLETRTTYNALGNTELPERVQQQLNSSKPIRSFKDLKILFHDLNTKRTAMIRAAAKKTVQHTS